MSNKLQLPSKFNERDKVVNDYIVSKLKQVVCKKGLDKSELTKQSLEAEYNTFMEKFSVNSLQKVFQCLESHRDIYVCKEYIINQLQTYFSQRKSPALKEKGTENLLEIKMNCNTIRHH